MPIFGFGKDRREGGSSQLVLAYLEDAQRIRCPFILKDARKTEHPASLQAVDEGAGTFTLQVPGHPAADKGSQVSFIFMMENLRLGARARVQGSRNGLLELELPSELELLERRKQARARLNPREGATVTALTGLFDGVGITGTLESISEGGARVRVDKALSIKGEKRLPLGSSLLPVGQELMLVKLNKLPKCPAVMELTGRVIYVDDSSGLCLGIAFEKPRQDVGTAIRNLVSSRSSAPPSSVPPRARRSTEPSQEESLLPARSRTVEDLSEAPEARKPEPEKGARPGARQEPVPPAEPQAAAAPVQDAPEPIPAEPPDEAVLDAAPGPQTPRNPALLRLKKRTRTIVVLTEHAKGQLLRDHLAEEGYGRVLVAHTWEELGPMLRQPNVGLVLLDTQGSALESMAWVQRFREADPDLPPFVLAAEEVSRAVVIAASRYGVSQLLVKPYALDENFSAFLEQQMGLA